MSVGAFDSRILVEKLQKLNNSQQSIETLSHWCIFHRKKARQIVQTWFQKFLEIKEQQVAFLYAANDILQNSRRKGGEFVSEFWKILPRALKEVIENGNDHGHNVVLRLVDIWEERKVFGSRACSLRELLIAKDPLPNTPTNNVKVNHHTIKIKVPSGGVQERLTSAYRSLHDAALDEDAILGRCNAATIRVEGLEREADTLQNTGDLQDTTLGNELQEQRNILTNCFQQLETIQLTRVALVSHLKEALHEQESKSELIRTQLQIAEAKAENVQKLRYRLTNGNSSMGEIIQHGPNENCMENQSHSSLNEEINKSRSTSSIAAELAAKLSSSASSAQMLTSVLSSLAAQEEKEGEGEEGKEMASTFGTMNGNLEGLVRNSLVGENQQRLDQPIDQITQQEGSFSYASHLHPPMQYQVASPKLNVSSVHFHASSSSQHHLSVPPFFLPPYQYNTNNVEHVNFPPYGPPLGLHPPISSSSPVVGVPYIAVSDLNINTNHQLQPNRFGSFYLQPSLPPPPW